MVHEISNNPHANDGYGDVPNLSSFRGCKMDMAALKTAAAVAVVAIIALGTTFALLTLTPIIFTASLAIGLSVGIIAGAVALATFGNFKLRDDEEFLQSH